MNKNLKFILISSILIISINNALSIQISSGKSNSTLISYAKDYQFVNGEQDSIYGEIITPIGDYNHDGYQDFLVGGRMYNGWQGKAWIYFGGPNGINNATPAFTIVGEPNINGNGICFGHAAIFAGDLSQNGTYSFIVGGPGSWGGWTVGKVYIFNDNSSVYPSSAGTYNNGEIVSPQKYDWLGETMSPLNDFNGDGYPDVVVGAPGSGQSSNPFYQGHAYIYLSSKQGLSLKPNIILTDPNNSEGFALSLSGTGDLNGDRLSDVAVGAYNYNNSEGRVFLYYGRNLSNGTLSPDVTINAPPNSYKFGYKVAIVKDVNGDGLDDLLVKGYYNNDSQSNSFVALYYGRKDNNYTIPDVVFSTGVAGDDFGYSMTSIGDYINNGYNYIAIGAPGSANTPNYEGYVYIYNGGKKISTTPAEIIKGEYYQDQFGYSIAAITYNSKIQLLIGAVGFDTNLGRVYLTMSRLPSEKDTITITDSNKLIPSNSVSAEFSFESLFILGVISLIRKKSFHR